MQKKLLAVKDSGEEFLFPHGNIFTSRNDVWGNHTGYVGAVGILLECILIFIGVGNLD